MLSSKLFSRHDRRDSPGKRVLGGLVALFLGVTGQARAQPKYLYTTIDPPGSGEMFVSGINTSGQIVGTYNKHGFLLDQGSYTPFDVPTSTATEA
jgi:hypothetical protein